MNYRVYNSNLGTIVGKTTVDSSNATEIRVIASPDGGFVVGYTENDSTPALKLRAYTRTGVADGAIRVFDTGTITDLDMGITGDGRVLLTYTKNGDVFTGIADARGTTIFTNNYDNPPLNFIDGDFIYARIAGGNILGDDATVDRIFGRQGNDSLRGGGGNDTIRGDAGNDSIRGDDGNDSLFGGFGNDSVNGGDGNDIIFMGVGEGFDTIDGGADNDTVSFSGRTDNILVDLDAQFYRVGQLTPKSLLAVENAITGSGSDTLSGTNVANKLDGQDGQDLLIGFGGNDTLDGGEQFDTVDYSYSTIPTGGGLFLLSSWVFDLAGTTKTAKFFPGFGPFSETDMLIDVERIIGSGWANRFITDPGKAMTLDGGISNDTFDVRGLSGNIVGSSFNGGNGIDGIIADLLWNNTVIFDLAAGVITVGGATRVTLSSIENVAAGGSAQITGKDLNNRLEALGPDARNNTIDGRGGNDTIIGGNGADNLIGGSGDDLFIDNLEGFLTTITGTSGNNALDLSGAAFGVTSDISNNFFVSSLQRLATSGLYTLIATDQADDLNEGSFDSISAGAGNDTLEGSVSGPFDRFDGGDDIDTFEADGQAFSYDLLSGAVSSGGTLTNFENFTGGFGKETVFGTDGDNVLRGEEGADSLVGRGGNDDLRGGTGIDILEGGTGSDSYYVDNALDQTIELANEGTDIVFASASYSLRDFSQHTENLTLIGTTDINGTGNGLGNFIRGNAGANRIDGASGSDTILAGAGSDTVIGGNGADSVNLDDGDDVFIDNTQGPNAGNDTVNGGTGKDTITGDGGNDVLRGDGGNDSIIGGNGNDSIDGGTGADFINSGNGMDTVAGGDGADSVLLGSGDDRFVDTGQGGANGQDTVFGGNGQDTIVGGGGDDEFRGQTGNDSVSGGAGADLIYGGSGEDTLVGGSENDTVFGGDGKDRVLLGAGNDTFFDSAQSGTDGQDTVFGDDGNDSIVGGGGSDEFHGGKGNDTITGDTGNDSIFGGDGFDSINSGNGADLVIAGNGRDSVVLGNGNDRFVDSNQGGVNGEDSITGGLGADTFAFKTQIGLDEITDFQKGIDKLELTEALWGGGLTELQVVNTYANDVGANTVFDFGNGNIIFLTGVASLAGLEADLILV